MGYANIEIIDFTQDIGGKNEQEDDAFQRAGQGNAQTFC